MIGLPDAGKVAETGERRQRLDGVDRGIHGIHHGAGLIGDVGQHAAERAGIEAKVAEAEVAEASE